MAMCDRCGLPIKPGEPTDKRINPGASLAGSDIILHKAPCKPVEVKQPLTYPRSSRS
jgi:hypothetical protein